MTAPDPLLGTEVGRYRIDALLGEGGMGRVYVAVQPAIGSRVAIKVLSDACARDPDLLERFFAEARAVNVIAHEHIINVFDFARLPDGRPFIVMELVDGETLGAIIRRERAPLGGVISVVREVLSALGAAHALGIVHRDLKPENVLVTAEGHAKVLDFGIAKLAPGPGSRRTKTGALLGTPAYMAPEQFSGAGEVDLRADIYAAGVMLYEAVTGKLPFEAAQLFDLMRAHVEQPPPSARASRPDVPELLDAAIATALAKSPADRFQSAAAMQQALDNASHSLAPDQWRSLSRRRSGPMPIRPSGPNQTPGALAPTAASPTPAPTAPNRHRWLFGALGAAALATLAILAVVRSSRAPSQATPPPHSAPPAPSPPSAPSAPSPLSSPSAPSSPSASPPAPSPPAPHHPPHPPRRSAAPPAVAVASPSAAPAAPYPPAPPPSSLTRPAD